MIELFTTPEEMDDIRLGDPAENEYGDTNAPQYGDSFEKIEKRIKAGEVPIYSKPHFLCLDLDSQDEFDVFQTRYTSFLGMVAVEDKFVIASPSGRGYHVYVLLKNDFSVLERIAMQAVLGSDPIREMLSVYKYVKGERRTTEDDFKENPTWLFEKNPDLLPEWTKPDWKRPVVDKP